MRGFLAALAIAMLPLVAAAKGSDSNAVVAYVFPQDNLLDAGQFDAHNFTRINYAFSNIANGRMVTGFAKDEENFAVLESLKKQNPSLTVLVSVGGWEWSDKFSDMSLTLESRKVFIASVMDFLKKYSLDGLDIDWEYPGLPGSTRNFRPEDTRNFTRLLEELRAAFHAEAAKTHKRLYLTIAAGSSDEFIAHTEMAKLVRSLDTVNLMCYDYYEPGSDKITGNHAPLFADPADPKHASSAASVEAFEKAGVPASKIVLGLPFYGHVWGQVADQNHGLFQPGKPVPNVYARYSAIAATMLNEGYVRYWDDKASVPYLYNAERQIWVSYEDPESIAAKAKFVKEHHLGGIMFWDYESDDTGTLIRAVNSSLAGQGAGGSAAK